MYGRVRVRPRKEELRISGAPSVRGYSGLVRSESGEHVAPSAAPRGRNRRSQAVVAGTEPDAAGARMDDRMRPYIPACPLSAL